MAWDPAGCGGGHRHAMARPAGPPSGMREVTEMTQIKLLVVMPVPEDQRDDDASRAASFSDEVNAILRFDGGWRLTMSGTDYPRATEEDTELAGAADDPPFKEAIESLARAVVAEPEPKADAADGTGADADADADRIKAHTRAKVLEIEVPEGSSTVEVRVEPEVFVEDGEPHVRVKVNDPEWVTDTSSDKDKDTSSDKDKDTAPTRTRTPADLSSPLAARDLPHHPSHRP